MGSAARIGAVAAAAVAVGAFVLVGLGGGEDEEEITEVIERVNAGEPESCDRDVTGEYLEQTLGIAPPLADESCEASASIEEANAEVEVSEIEVDGDTATAAVTYDGGGADGSKIAVELSKQSGDWRLERKTSVVELDRDGFERGYVEQLRAPEFGFSPAGVECATDGVTALTDEEVEGILLGEDVARLDAITVGCDRLAVEQLLVDPYRDPGSGFPPALASCVDTGIAEGSDADVVGMITNPTVVAQIALSCDRDAILASVAPGRSGLPGLTNENTTCVGAKLGALSDRALSVVLSDLEGFERVVASCEPE